MVATPHSTAGPSLTLGGPSGPSMPKRETKKRPPGRKAGGLACIGCTHYTPLTINGALIGCGDCAELDRTVEASYRGACAAYQFYGAKESS